MDLFINQNSEMLIRKIGLTLLHSLWIGIVLASAAGLTLLLTKKTKPEIRYNVLTGLLCVFVLAVGFTFLSMEAKSGQTDPVEDQVSLTAVNIQTHSPAPRHFEASIPENISTFLNRHAQTITFIWLLIIAVKSLRLGVGLYRLEHLKRNQIFGIGEDWEKRISRFAKQMGITKSVKVVQSGLVGIPMVLGHFKPVILVPLGVISSIPSDQIEMVLLHELAHIRRSDFFVNFLQHLAELLFFFNPAVLWVSALIRKERENCCDDLALHYSGNKIIYINALLSFREYQIANPVYSVAFSGESGLVQRARRIASRTNASLKLSEKIILAISVLMLFTFTVLFANNVAPSKIAHLPKPDAQAVREKVRQVRIPAKALQRPAENPVKVLRNNDVQPDTNQKTGNPGDYVQKLNPLLGLMPVDTLKPLKAEGRNPGRLVPVEKALAPLVGTARDYTEDIDRAYDSLAKKYDADRYKAYQPLTLQYKPYKFEKNERLAAFNERILSEIEKNGIAISRNNVDFHITNNELIVNGVKVSDEVHQKVLSAVLNSPTDRLDFTYGSHHDK